MNFDKQSILFILYLLCMLQYVCCAATLVLRYKTNSNIDYNISLDNKFDIISIPIILAWITHGFCIIFPWLNYGIYFGISHILSILSWVGLGLYIYEKRHPNMQTMRFIMVCMSAFCVCLPYFFTGIEILSLTNNSYKLSILTENYYVFLGHFLFMNISYAILIWVCIHILIMIPLEKNLHNPQKYSYQVLQKCPPLLYMQLILKQRMYVLWYFMTLVIASGIYLWIKEDLSYITHKIIFSLISWIVFLLFLYKKYKNGISSKKTMHYIIVIFSFWLLSYVGSNFIINIFKYKII